MTYQDTDREVIDYRLVTLPGTQALIRGPLPPNFEAGGYVCAIGAAQTFGRFVIHTFLDRVGAELGVETLNLGLAGGGPRHFASRPGFMAAANRASLVILQVMSGRSVSNSYFENPGAGSLRPRNAPPERKPRHAELEYTDLYLSEGEEFIKGLLEETRQNYLADYDLLLSRLKVPVLLFWFSTRTPDYPELYSRDFERPAGGFLGSFPQLVNQAVFDALKAKVADHAECVSARGLPQPLYSRFTREMTDLGIAPHHPGHNNYYPSPEMHEDAAATLIPVVKRMLERGAADAPPEH